MRSVQHGERRWGMKLLSARGHALVDYLTAPALWIAVRRAGLREPARSSALVFVPLILLAVTTTRTPLGLLKIVPHRLHGRAEFASVLVQLALPWLRGFANDDRGRTFVLAFAAYNFVVWCLTNWTTCTDDIVTADQPIGSSSTMPTPKP